MSDKFDIGRRRFGQLLTAGSIFAAVAPMSVGAENDRSDTADPATDVPALASAPWQVPPSTVVVSEEMKVRSGDTVLAGTLTLPKHQDSVGAVVVLHGASSPLRTSPLYQHLTQMLPSIGLAVFVFDRRGSGESGGVRENASFEDLAEDGIAAVDALCADSRIDPARIGVWGLSQGGWLSVMAASRSPNVKFVISISAPLVTPDVQMMFLSTNTLQVFGYSKDDINQMRATRAAVANYIRGTGDRETAQRALDIAKKRPWFRYLYLDDTVNVIAVSERRSDIENDPAATLEDVKAPVLVLYGAADPVVPVSTSMERIAEIKSRLPNLKYAVIADADHGMEIGADPRRLLDPEHIGESRPNAVEYFAVMTNWLTEQGIAKGI